MKAQFLRIGQRFEIPTCAQLMRNLVCLRITPTSVYARGDERKDTNSPWKTNYDYIGCGTEVQPLNEIVEIKRSDNNELIVAGELTGIEKRKRGRKGSTLEFPPTPFSIEEVSKLNNCSTTKVYLKVIAMVKTGEMDVVEEIKNKRGKSKKIYQLMDFIGKETVVESKPQKLPKSKKPKKSIKRKK